ncbi:hypothetical protein HO133_001449 [Letharia lupina]|uniref:Zn(2)-C6 fungal-type domain-containing protein n=1 Tax=Letharia lupina TaxID=560253 RepID=A0A8H6FC24_9LECA|nr:uncharacterized protein HO133_001449 [Letharia lupina]KAF6222363.1 hypothetical protein HO133_001449 [Letharia lupina]
MANAAPQQLADPISGNSQNASHAGDISASPLHKRTYQACIPCRKRKVRCDLGPVDEPHDPPCVRCRREAKECYFSATRRKRKADSEDGQSAGDGPPDEEFAAHLARKKSVRTSGSFDQQPLPNGQQSLTSGPLPATSPLDGYDLPRQRPLQQDSPYATKIQLGKAADGQDQEVSNETAAALFQSPINVPGDALHLLLKASDESEHMQRKDTASLGERSTNQSVRTSNIMHGRYNSGPSSHDQAGQNYPLNIDPAISGSNADIDDTPIPIEALRLWSRLRFVRAGWFTAKEAISYIDYFYKCHSPLTPISLPAFDSHAAYSNLVNDEPMLTVTVLTIASRYMELSGPGGKTRSFMIHERLWSYLQNMITRMFWGQEQFGGGFCGAGTRRPGQPNSGKGGLRTLGTIESLLLLNEFHPRSMHFPPRDDDDDILAPADDADTPADEKALYLGSTWSEPAVRSDRMCWSLIGTSYVLAYELGIFGTYSDGVLSVDGIVKRKGGATEYNKRADRIERMLYVFVTQASGRFGIPSMCSDQINQFAIESVKEGFVSVDSTMLKDPVDRTQQSWLELMIIMKDCNDRLFSSKDQTTKLVQTEAYIVELHQLQPLLYSWQKRFNALDLPVYPRVILSIEYHYITLYINSLALQAVMEHWAAKANPLPQGESPQSPVSTMSSSYASVYNRNEPYIREVIDSSRTVLRHVLDVLLPNDHLKHAPVRTYFRIISAAMFLLKTFALGGKEDEVAVSLRLLKDTVKALRTSVVDDVHLCLRIADVLESLIKAINTQFVRLPPGSLSTPEQAKRTTHLSEQQAHFASDGYQTGTKNFNPSDRFQYDDRQGPLAGISRTYNSPHDSNISIMPPIGNNYASFNPNNNFVNTFTQSPNQNQHHNQPQQPFYSNGDDPMAFPSDWLTLDLQPLLGNDGVEGGDNPWFGAFGPETHNNLEVLGKLVNDSGYKGDGFGEGAMEF